MYRDDEGDVVTLSSNEEFSEVGSKLLFPLMPHPAVSQLLRQAEHRGQPLKLSVVLRDTELEAKFVRAGSSADALLDRKASHKPSDVRNFCPFLLVILVVIVRP